MIERPWECCLLEEAYFIIRAFNKEALTSLNQSRLIVNSHVLRKFTKTALQAWRLYDDFVKLCS